jgi:hypothetical protein
MREVKKVIDPLVSYAGYHPDDRNMVGNKIPAVLIRKGDEDESDVLNLKGYITKVINFEIMLITENNRFEPTNILQTDIETAVTNIPVNAIEGLYCIQWAGVEEPTAEQTATAFSFDSANKLGNRKLTLLKFRAIINQRRGRKKVSVTGVAINELQKSALPLFGVPQYYQYQFEWAVAPANASNQSVTWASSDDTVATITNAGLMTVLEADREVTMTVTTVDGSFNDSVTFTTRDPIVAVNIDLNALEIKMYTGGDPIKLEYSVSSLASPPWTEPTVDIGWLSTDTSVAIVTQTGLVTPLAAGTCEIEVSDKIGDVAATCLITVVEKT